MPIQILWADDEIDLLKPTILYLKEKGYDVTPVTNGKDAIDKVETQRFDVVFLDESMPGLTGLETLMRIKEKHTHLPCNDYKKRGRKPNGRSHRLANFRLPD